MRKSKIASWSGIVLDTHTIYPKRSEANQYHCLRANYLFIIIVNIQTVLQIFIQFEQLYNKIYARKLADTIAGGKSKIKQLKL